MIKQFLRGVVVAIVVLAGAAGGEVLTLPLEERPEWLGNEGIVMAGSWEPLLFRVRRDGSDGYTATAEQRAGYEREHSPEMVEQLKALGVNFVMMHCYKGGGLEAERDSMEDAVQFSQRCHDAGLHVGVYNYSGAFIWELLFKEMPEAKDWVLLDADGQPHTYGKAAYRYYWNRNHPDAQAFYRQLIDFSVQKIKTDLVHLDNYGAGPGTDRNSVERFREHLRTTFSPEKLQRMGVADLATVQPPLEESANRMLRWAWMDFSAQSLADSYWAMSRYARSLRKDVLMECNPSGPGETMRQLIDHGRLLEGGEAFWDEGGAVGYKDGKLHTRIGTYKIARRMDNMAFAYTTTPLEMAESMAFNLDCLGCICWFEYGRIVRKPGSKESLAPDIGRFIRFFNERRDLFREAKVVADVAILRSYRLQVFGEPKYAALTARVEQALIDASAPFQIIYDQHLGDLKRYRALVLAGCVALSDEQIGVIEQYVKSGGRLCVIGPVATHDEWMTPREKPDLADLAPETAVRASEQDDILDAVRRACGGTLSLSATGVQGLCCELTEQPGRRLVHLVNYRADAPARDIEVRVALPNGSRAKGAVLVSPEQEKDLPLTFKEEAGNVAFTVPQVNVYSIAVIACSECTAPGSLDTR